jgi:hypothetical protein
MRRLFADRLVLATGLIVILMSALFALWLITCSSCTKWLRRNTTPRSTNTPPGKGTVENSRRSAHVDAMTIVALATSRLFLCHADCYKGVKEAHTAGKPSSTKQEGKDTMATTDMLSGRRSRRPG